MNRSASGIQFPVPDALIRVCVRSRAGRERAPEGGLRALQPNVIRLFCATDTQGNSIACRLWAARLRQRCGALAPALRFALRSKRRLERVTRLELATSTLARWCSTN